MIGRDQLREAIALYRNEAFVVLDVSPELRVIVEAAELVADPDTLVIRTKRTPKGDWSRDWIASVAAAAFPSLVQPAAKWDRQRKVIRILDALLEGQPK